MIRLLLIATAMAACASASAGSLDGILIEQDLSTAFNRDHYKHWVDEDGDGQDARQEALIAESLIPVAFDDEGKVESGLWVGPYTSFVTRDPGTLDVDHLGPLKEAHRSGAANWTPQRREAYANDLIDRNHLIAVWNSANRSKSDKDPADRMPPNRAYWCEYLDEWVAVKRKWELSMDTQEADAVKGGLVVCDRYKMRDHIDGRH